MSAFSLRSLTLAAGLALAAVEASAAGAYVLGSPDATLNSDSWALSSSNMSDFRTAITNPLYFGTGGTVTRSITITDMASITPTTLSAINGLIVPWWNNSQSAPVATDVINAFKTGMDLWLLEDDSGHNQIGTTLGIGSSTASGTVSNGTAPFFTGPFGTATNTATFGNFDQFSSTSIVALGGTVIGTNASGQITAVYWAKGTFTATSGALIVFSDVDMISNAYQNPYTPTLGANGILALNTMATLASPTAVPEPSTYAMLLGGIGLAGLRRWWRRRTVTSS